MANPFCEIHPMCIDIALLAVGVSLSRTRSIIGRFTASTKAFFRLATLLARTSQAYTGGVREVSRVLGFQRTAQNVGVLFSTCFVLNTTTW